jgi:hypothetical protein
VTDEPTDHELLQLIIKELANIRQLTTSAVNAIRDAESEIPEKMRRFMNYMHDIHDVKFMYEELGHPIPDHLKHELERCDDRYRQLLKEQHTDGGTFEKVRREMAKDPENRYDHTRLLANPKGEI